MKKIVAFLLVVCLCVCFSACQMTESPSSSDTSSSPESEAASSPESDVSSSPESDASSSSEESSYADLPQGGQADRDLLSFFSYEDYQEYMNTHDVPEAIVRYEKLSFLGEFDSLVFVGFRLYYDQYSYALIDSAGDEVELRVFYNGEMTVDPKRELPLTDQTDLRHYPEKASGHVIFGNLKYNYSNGELWFIDFQIGESIFRIDVTSNSSEGGTHYLLSEYPTTGRNEFIQNLLSTETAIDAVKYFGQEVLGVNVTNASFSPKELTKYYLGYELLKFEKYQEQMRTQDVPETFLRYEQISFLGEYAYFALLKYDLSYEDYVYILKDSTGYGVHFYVFSDGGSATSNPTLDPPSNGQTDLRTYPEKVNGTRQLGNIEYNYDQGKLFSIRFCIDENSYTFGVTPDSTPEDKRSLLLSEYPTEGGNEFIQKLLSTETALDAVKYFEQEVLGMQATE